MELTVNRREQIVVMDGPAADMASVISALRESSLRRAAPGTAVDEPGITGVLSGPAPLLWAYDGVRGERLASIVNTAPEVEEVYVDQRAIAAADALVATGEWELRDIMDQQVFRPAQQPAPTVTSDYAIAPAGPAEMHLVRRAIATAYQLPIHTVEASYPDDFFLVAAPARLFVARTQAGEVIGTIGHRQQGDAAMMFGLSVRTDHRRRHVASALLATAMRSAAEDGAQLVHGLSCDTTRRLAEEHGFRRAGGWLYLLRRAALA